MNSLDFSRFYHQHSYLNIRRWLLLSLFLVVLSSLYFPSSPALAKDDEPPETHPTIVRVGLGVIDIPDINEPAETFDIHSYLVLEWNDPEAYRYVRYNEEILDSGEYKSDSTPKAAAVLNDIGWANILQFTNQVGQREILNACIHIEPNGDITYNERFQATFFSKYYLTAFPFDSQKLHIEIETFNLNRDLVVFTASSDTVMHYVPLLSQYTEDEGYELEEWILEKEIQTRVSEYTSPMTGQTYSYVAIDIGAKRKTGFHIWRIFLPLVLIIAISWSVFWIGGARVEGKMSIAALGFLTAVSFSFFVHSHLPKISYLTFMDLFIIGIYFYMGFTVLQILSTYFLTNRRRDTAAEKLNYHSRWLFPAVLMHYWLILAMIMV